MSWSVKLIAKLLWSFLLWITSFHYWRRLFNGIKLNILYLLVFNYIFSLFFLSFAGCVGLGSPDWVFALTPSLALQTLFDKNINNNNASLQQKIFVLPLFIYKYLCNIYNINQLMFDQYSLINIIQNRVLKQYYLLTDNCNFTDSALAVIATIPIGVLA